MPRDRAEEAKRGSPARRKYHRQSTDTADWGGIDPRIIAECIAKVTFHGGAIRFGYTRDGGAYSIGIYGDGDPYTEYLRPSEDVAGILREIGEAFTANGNSPK